MERFISRNKKTISLPVPLGTEVFIVSTRCGDVCLFEKDKFNKLIPPEKGGRCSHNLPCHTRILPPRKVILNIENISILKEWKVRVFPTEKEAKEATIKITNENIKFLNEKGFAIDGEGKCIKKEE